MIKGAERVLNLVRKKNGEQDKSNMCPNQSSVSKFGESDTYIAPNMPVTRQLRFFPTQKIKGRKSSHLSKPSAQEIATAKSLLSGDETLIIHTGFDHVY